jgi:hypothetical protein
MRMKLSRLVDWCCWVVIEVKVDVVDVVWFNSKLSARL